MDLYRSKGAIVRGLETGEDPITAPAGSALGHRVVRPIWLELQDETMRRLDALTLDELCTRANRVGIAGRPAPPRGRGS